MHASHDSPLVIISILIAIIASYTALALTTRVAAARDRARRAWLLGGSIAMGTGIWSMHFVGMLAFRLPVQIAYDLPLVLLSLLAAIAASALALIVAARPTVHPLQLVAAAFVMGGGIAAMHYTGMAAMRLPAVLTYHGWLVVLSLVIAVTASGVALWIFRWLRNDWTRHVQLLRAGAAVLLGFAITGLHYTAMTAAHFSELPGSDVSAYRHTGMLIASNGLAVALIVGTVLILVLTLVGSLVDHWVRVKLAGAEALKESEERYRSVVSQVHEVIFRTDAEGRWVFLNPAWTAITGFTVSESLGTTLLNYVHPEDRAQHAAAMQSVVEGPHASARIDVRYLTRSGGTRWLEVHSSVSRDEKGRFLGSTGTLRDVTDQRQAEEELRSAREVAEAANRAKSEFLSRMSHELRTPLNAILGFGQLLELEELSDDNKESVQHILRGGRHLLDLINEVLDITGIEAGRLRLSLEPVHLGAVVRETVELVKPLAAQRGVVLDASDVQDDSLYVSADRQRLKQVLLNLVSNAIKYNVTDGRVRVSTIKDAQDKVRIFVQDSGEGIPLDRMHRLFTPFERLGAEHSDVEGTGLGLALSKRLAEAMGGRIGAESVVGEGSTFWIELVSAIAPETGIEAGDVVVLHDRAPTAANRTTILYVEDNLANFSLVERILSSRREIDLISCMQGELALELARLHKPELVLLDLHLPDLPGEEVLRRLRQSPGTRSIPVLIVSADATVGQEERLAGLGAQGYVTKPLELTTFVRAVDAILSPKAQAA